MPWLPILQAVCLLLTAFTLAFTLAHAAELPGKMRLDKAQYLAVHGFLLVAAMQATYWLAIHPVNKFWLANESLPRASAGFFGVGKAPRGSGADDAWKAFRDRWEYAHAARAAMAFVLLCIHVVAQ